MTEPHTSLVPATAPASPARPEQFDAVTAAALAAWGVAHHPDFHAPNPSWASRAKKAAS